MSYRHCVSSHLNICASVCWEQGHSIMIQLRTLSNIILLLNTIIFKFVHISNIVLPPCSLWQQSPRAPLVHTLSYLNLIDLMPHFSGINVSCEISWVPNTQTGNPNVFPESSFFTFPYRYLFSPVSRQEAKDGETKKEAQELEEDRAEGPTN